MFFHVLAEGLSDIPAVHEILVRGIGITAGADFRIYPHKGKGQIPTDIHAPPRKTDRTLLGQLPAKLRAYGQKGKDHCVVVLVDADKDNCRSLKNSLLNLYKDITPRPKKVLIRVAVEETESWFIADTAAVVAAFPTASTQHLATFPPDSVVGAWERLAECIGLDPLKCSGRDKEQWAKQISPHLDLKNPKSPSLRAFVTGIKQHLR